MRPMPVTRWPDAGNDPVVRGTADEAALLERIAAAEIAAFEALYRLYYPRLMRFLLGVTRRAALADEVLDDTMLVVWRKAHTFDATSKVSTWLFAIAYRQALKALRRVDCVLAYDEREAEGASRQDPEREMQLEQLHVRLGEAMDALPPPHRAVIELTYYQGHSCREIAQIMECPVATVKTRMFHARRKLKGILDRDIGREAL
jgi:RNA polymerase sigma factor (sigma-70 family)